VSVASPLAPGARAVAPRAAWKRSPRVPELITVSGTAIAATVAAAAPAAIRTGRRGIGARRARRCSSTRARRLAGAPTSAAALRASATARRCSARRSARSGDDDTRASSAERRSGESDPSASAASSATSRLPDSSRRRRLNTVRGTVTPNPQGERRGCSHTRGPRSARSYSQGRQSCDLPLSSLADRRMLVTSMSGTWRRTRCLRRGTTAAGSLGAHSDRARRASGRRSPGRGSPAV
jgi:hypothetical protein